MLDIKYVRENPDIIKKDLEKRNQIEKIRWVDELIGYEKTYRERLQEIEVLRHKRNIISEEINTLKKQGKGIADKVLEAKELPNHILNIENELNALKEKIKHILMNIPNILHESVPVGKDDTGNVVIRTRRKPTEKEFELIPHGELIESMGLANFSDAAIVSGAGFYYLIGDIAMLELALINYAIDTLVKKGYTLVSPPMMLRRKPYEGVTSLEDFENVMYKIENDDLYLIATSEHSIGAMLMDKVLDSERLPLRYIGFSPCFRREIGSHGIDTKGLFRVHQFYKIEQFIYCMPQDSWKLHEELIKNAEEIFSGLKLPYRVVNICTGDIGSIASKKYDIEVHMPREDKYREVVSCSNCTSYQAVRLNIRFKKGDEREYVHTLNSTAIATTRAIRAIIENYQQKNGSIKIPTVLQKYMGSRKVIKKSK